MNKYFKIYPGWQHQLTPDNIINLVSFVFTIEGHDGILFKTNETLAGMDCFEFAFDTDNGMYIKEGDMQFNHFIGDRIIDSSTDAISFIRNYLYKNGLSNLIK